MNTKISESDKKKSLEFEANYKDFLMELAQMPKDTVEDKERRYKWFKEHTMHDDIIIDLMDTLRPRAYEKLRKRLSLDKNGEMYKGLESDFDIASFKYTKEIDPVVYMETVIESIKTYTGVNSKKEHVPFIVYVRKKYKQNAEKASGINMEAETGRGLVMPVTQDRNKVYIIKLIKSLNNLKERFGNHYSLEQLVSMAIEESEVKHKFTKNEINTAIIKVYALDVRYLDSEIDEDGNSLEEIIGEVEKEFEKIDNSGILQKFIQRLAENPEKFWSEVSVATNKESREWIKIFLTKDILIALKLDDVIMKLPQNYLKGRVSEVIQSNLMPEPKCGQWCPRAKRCSLNSDGCYIRYDKIRENPPYGNDDIYFLLETEGDIVYKNLLHKKYLDGALLNENLEDVWKNKLYINPNEKKEGTEQVFDFTDATIGRILGIKEEKDRISNAGKNDEKDKISNAEKNYWKSKISHARKNYEKARAVMYKLFLEM